MNTPTSKLILVGDAWALPTSDGLIAGKGASVSYKIKSRPGLFALWTAVRESLAAGPLTLEELSVRVGPKFPPGVVRDVLPQLARLGLVAEDVLSGAVSAESSAALCEHPLWGHFSARSNVPAVHVARVAEARVGLVCGGAFLGPLSRALGEQGFRHVTALSLPADTGLVDKGLVERLVAASDFVVAAAATAIERLQCFHVVNECTTKAKMPWLSAYVDHDTAVVGPLFIPGETACFNCLELREENHLPNLAEYRQFRALVRKAPVPTRATSSPFALAHAVQAIVSETVLWTSQISLPSTYQTLVEVNVPALEHVRHTVLKVPLCDVCGPHVERPFRRVWDV